MDLKGKQVLVAGLKYFSKKSPTMAIGIDAIIIIIAILKYSLCSLEYLKLFNPKKNPLIVFIMSFLKIKHVAKKVPK